MLLDANLLRYFDLFLITGKQERLSLLSLLLLGLAVAGLEFIFLYSLQVSVDLLFHNYQEDNFIMDQLTQFSDSQIIIFLFLFFIFKLGFMLCVKWRTFSFFEMLKARITISLVKGFFKHGYDYVSERNSNEIFRNLFYEIGVLIGVAVKAPMNIISEVAIISGVVIYLTVSQGRLVLIAILLIGLIGLAWQFVSARWVRALGSRRVILEAERVRVFQDVVQGFLDIASLKVSDYVIDKASDITRKSAIVASNYQLSQLFPRAVLETALVLAVVFICFYGLIVIDDLPSMVGGESTAAVLGFAALRLLPSVSSITLSFQNIIFGLPSAKLIFGELSALNITGQSENFAAFDVRGNSSYGHHIQLNQSQSNKHFSVSFNNVSYKYTGTPTAVFKNFNFCLNSGQIYGITGPSGSGKSTFVNLLFGILNPTAGSIKLNNISKKELRISYIPQSVFMFNSDIKSNISLGRLEQLPEVVADELFLKSCHIACLTSVVDDLNARRESSVGDSGARLSGGQRQRIGVARAVLLPAEVFIFDETFANLDMITSKMILKRVGDEFPHSCIIVVAHDERLIEVCDHVLDLGGEY